MTVSEMVTLGGEGVCSGEVADRNFELFCSGSALPTVDVSMAMAIGSIAELLLDDICLSCFVFLL